MTTPLKALILEDLQADAELMLHELRRAGFDPNWKRVQSEGEFLANLAPDVDVILADYHLPMFDATRALELLQQRALDIPFIVVSGTITEESAVECMKRGASDYLLKDRLARLGPAVIRALEDRRVREGKRQVEERYRWVSENIMDAVFLLDLEGHVVFTNRRGEELTGYPEAEQRGRPIWSLLAPEGAAEAQRRLQAVRSGQGVDPSFETEVVRRDGVRVSVESNVTSVFKDGQLVGRLAVVHDISTRRRAETALRDTSQRLQTLIDAAPVAIIAMDEAWRVVLWNKSATRMLGWNEHEVLGQAVPTIPDHKRAEFDAAVAQNRRGVATLYETQRRRKDGTLIDVISSTAPLVDARGRVTGSMGVLVDLAEQKQLEEQLRQSQKMEAVGQLAGGIAHDFNNLLTVIGGRTYLLLTTLPEKHPGRPNVELIQETAERAAVLTRQLLAFSRKQILALQVLDLNTIVASIERILRRLIGEHIQLVIEPSATPGWVKVDPGQMEQVILNLSVNARDAMPEGGRLTIRTAHVGVAEAAARTHAEIQAGPAVLLEVRDTGIGMTDEIRTRIFEPFFTTKPAGHGTGLGLATVYGIVKQSGGTIEVLSQPGQGSTFQIYLPRVEETEATSPTDAPAPRHIGGSETILLVEDAEDVRDLARDILGLMGYNLMTASNPVEAIQVSQDHSGVIHLLLTDVVMPGMSGRQLADRLVADRPGLKVLFMSGYTDNAIVHHGVLDPGTAFVQKPFTPDSLSRKVREVLDAS